MTLIFLFCVTSVSRTQRFAESGGFEPSVHFRCTPHFECGSFDHSDNFPIIAIEDVAKVQQKNHLYKRQVIFLIFPIVKTIRIMNFLLTVHHLGVAYTSCTHLHPNSRLT